MAQPRIPDGATAPLLSSQQPFICLNPVTGQCTTYANLDFGIPTPPFFHYSMHASYEQCQQQCHLPQSAYAAVPLNPPNRAPLVGKMDVAPQLMGQGFSLR